MRCLIAFYCFMLSVASLNQQSATLYCI